MQEIPSKPLAFIWFAIRPFRKRFFLVLFFVFLMEVFVGLQSYVFKGFVDTANSYAAHGGPISPVFWWVLAYPTLLLLSHIADRISGFQGHPLAVFQRTWVMRSMFSYLSLHSLSYFNDRFSGALSSRVTSLAQNTARIMWQFISNFFSLLITITISAVLISFASHKVALVFLGGFVLLIPINYLLTRKQAALSKRLSETRAKMHGQVIDSISNIAAVQQYARRSHEINRLDNAIAEHREADIKSDLYGEWVLVINNILIGLLVATIVFWSFYLWRDGAITVGVFIMVVTLTRGFMSSLSGVGQNLNSIMEAYGEIQNDLAEIIKPHDLIDKPKAKKLEIVEGVVSFENTTFAYGTDQRKIFDNLSFKIKGGQKVGIVGTSGAGKTTLMKLLLRQHDLVGGKIMIDGQDVSGVTQESLRESVSIVPQEPMLFHRTIRENIMYGKLHATEAEMIDVAKKAQAHDFIEQLPNKYESLVGERGVKLSVGQRQRIAIARAFLKNAPILILDEATSALDSESEVAVQKALQALMEGKTVFAIAHRLSTLREMDRILVFKDGQVVEDGTHRTLLKNKEGVYASFWTHQAGGFIKED